EHVLGLLEHKQPKNHQDHYQCEEKVKQDKCNVCKCSGQSAESKYRRNNCKYGTYRGPFQKCHFNALVWICKRKPQAMCRRSAEQMKYPELLLQRRPCFVHLRGGEIEASSGCYVFRFIQLRVTGEDIFISERGQHVVDSGRHIYIGHMSHGWH